MRDAARTPPFGIAVALALLAGVVTCLGLPRLVPWPLAMLLLLVGLALWWVPKRVAPAAPPGVGHGAGDAWPARAARILGALLLGAGLAGLHAAYSLSLQLPASLEKRDAVVSGRIVSLPEHEPRRTRFLFRVDRDAMTPLPLRGRLLRLAWYDEAPTARKALQAGQRWQLPVRLRAPRGLRNPGGVDSEQYALAQRVAATGYVHDPVLARQLSPATGLDAWREAMSARIADQVPSEASRFVRALALGDTRALTDDDWAKLRADGLTHLIAISGFHVGLVAGFLALLARGLWWLWPALGRRWPAPVAAAVAALFGAAVYSAVAGFALPTIRTLLMIAVVAGARVWRRPLNAANALALAAVMVLLVDPLAVLGAGFWLSFLGVAWLLWCLPHGVGKSLRAVLGEFFSAQGVATLGLLPLSVALFGQASLAGPVANLVAVPWWSLVVVPLSLIGLGLESACSGAGTWAWRAAARCFDLSWPLFERLAGSDLALWWLPEPRWFALPLALLGAFWLLLPRGVPGKPLALLLWLPLLWPDRDLPRPGEAELVVIDVGQGLSVVVRTHEHTLLYDMGPSVRDGFDAGERAVVPALHALGVRRLDKAVISHGDNDHAGGFEAVQREFPAAALFAPAGIGLSHRTTPCIAGRGWRWNGVRFRFLHPPPHFPYLKNESSCVLRIETAHGTALLTGDIGEVIERDLVRLYSSDLRAEVVLVAHHGSGGSSDPAFVEATGARFALVASGHGNRFHHPKPEVVQRWQHLGAETFDTSVSGALRIGLRARGIQLETRRGAQPRLWDAARRP